MSRQIEKSLQIGIDIGSTTTKVAVFSSEQGKIIYSDYQRHHAEQAHLLMKLPLF